MACKHSRLTVLAAGGGHKPAAGKHQGKNMVGIMLACAGSAHVSGCRFRCVPSCQQTFTRSHGANCGAGIGGGLAALGHLQGKAVLDMPHRAFSLKAFAKCQLPSLPLDHRRCRHQPPQMPMQQQRPLHPAQLTASISWCVLSVTASSWVNSTNCGGRPWLPSGDVSEASIAAAGREQQKGV